MKEINRVFFGEKGITSTSANHLANLAKECMESNCGKPLKSYQESYCSKQCFWEFSRKSYIDRWFRNWGC